VVSLLDALFRRGAWPLVFLSLTLGCTGTVIDQPGAGGAPPGSAAACGPSTGTRIWRLSDEQFAAAVADLLPGVKVPPVTTPGRSAAEFVNLADSYPVTGGLTSSVRTAAKAAATAAVKDLPGLLRCAPGQAERPCLDAFIDRFATRAFRRPLEPAERQDLAAVYGVGAQNGSGNGVRLLLEAILQSPSFLYRTELGQPGRPITLDAYELASALSFFLLDSIPDDELWRAAQDGSLSDPAVLDRQSSRLLTLPRVRENVARMFLKWLGLGAGVTTELAAAEFPEYDQPLRASLLAESKLFLADLVARNGTVAELLTSRKGFVDQRLAKLYGVPYPAGATGFVEVTLPETERAGILTQGGVLVSKSRGHPVVIRGKFVRKELLCDDIPSPPPSVNTQQFANRGLDERQQAEARMGDSVCGACHTLMDPLGLAFSQYDAMSRFVPRTPDGKAVDARSAVQFSDVDGPVAGAVELAQRLAGSARVRGCLARKVLSYAVGRELGPADQCEQRRLEARLQEGGGRLLDLVTGILQSPGFRQRLGGP
jgi:hypothetical protein